jgi:phycobilisome core linker protein
LSSQTFAKFKAEQIYNANSRIGESQIMRMFKVTACVPSQTRIRTQRELQNTYFTKLVPYDNWFTEQQRIMKMGGKIVKVELATGKPGANTGLL